MEPAPETYPTGSQVRHRRPKDEPVQGKVYSVPPPTQPKFYLKKCLTSSSSRPAFFPRWHAHLRAVVFYNLHRGKIDTRLCPLIRYIFLRSTLTFSPPQELSFTSFRNSSPHPLPPSPRPLLSPLQGQFPPVPTTATLIMSLELFPTLHTGLTVIV